MPCDRSACISGERSLLVLFLDQNAIRADFPAEWPIAAEILPGSPLVSLSVANPLADPLALELGDRREDREDELGDAVTGDITAKIEQSQRDPPALEL